MVADREAVTVYLPSGDHRLLARHCEDLDLSVSTLLRRLALVAVRATARPGVTPAQLVEGAAAAIGRDLPATFPATKSGRRWAARVAGSVMRWLLARCAVLPLPAPGPGGERVWRVSLSDGAATTVRYLDTGGADGGQVEAAGLALPARDWLAVAAAVVAAANLDPITYQDVTEPRS